MSRSRRKWVFLVVSITVVVGCIAVRLNRGDRDPRFVGVWIGSGFWSAPNEIVRIELCEDGTGVASNGMYFQWRVSDNVLLLRWKPPSLQRQVEVFILRILPIDIGKLEITNAGNDTILLRSSSGGIVRLTRVHGSDLNPTAPRLIKRPTTTEITSHHRQPITDDR